MRLREFIIDVLECTIDLEQDARTYVQDYFKLTDANQRKLFEHERNRLEISNTAFEATITRLERENEILRGNPGNWQKSAPANTNQTSKLCVHWRKRELNPVYGRCAVPGASNHYCDCITAMFGCPQSLFPLDEKPK